MKMNKVITMVHYLIIFTKIYLYPAGHIINLNNANELTIVVGSTSIFIFFDRRTLKFFRVKCNPTNKKALAFCKWFSEIKIICKFDIIARVTS